MFRIQSIKRYGFSWYAGKDYLNRDFFVQSMFKEEAMTFSTNEEATAKVKELMQEFPYNNFSIVPVE